MSQLLLIALTLEILLRKMKKYGLDDSAIQWLESYLNLRTQYVSVAGKDSTMKMVPGGVPQGSVLGPVSFTIYTNELSEATKNVNCDNSEHVEEIEEDLFGQDCNKCGITPVYADDSTHVVRSTDRQINQQQLANNLQKITIFLQSNNLTVNQSKTKIMETIVPQKRCKLSGNEPMLAVLNVKKR